MAEVNEQVQYRYFPIVGGWMAYIERNGDDGGVSVGCCFIPDPNHTREPKYLSYDDLNRKDSIPDFMPPGIGGGG